MQLVGLMKQLVPEFVSNNSQFEQLDTTKVVRLKKWVIDFNISPY